MALRLAALVFAALCSALSSAAPLHLSSGALDLQLNDAGRITAMDLAGRDCLAPKAVAQSGFALRDHQKDEGFVALACTVESAGGKALLKAQREGITLEAQISPMGNGFQVQGSLSRTGPQRYVSLRFGLPVDVTGFTWWRDVVRGEPMEPGGSKQYLGAPDPVPFAAISSDAGALGLAVRMDEQWFHRKTYDAEAGQFGITFRYAFVDGQRSFENSIPFRFYILAPAGPWGLRAVIDSYFALFDQWARDDAIPPGGWMAWGDVLRHDPPASDLGLVLHEMGYSSAEQDDKLGVLSLPYIEPSMYQQYHGDLDGAPTREAAYARIEHNAKAQLPDVIVRSSSDKDESRRQWVHDISAGILAAPVRDEDGGMTDPVCGNWPWIGDKNFGAQFPLNLLPNLPGGVGQVRLAECKTAIDGMYLDCYGAHGSRRDFNPDSVKASPTPPAFSDGLKPYVAVWSELIAWTEALKAQLGPERQCILPNVQGLSFPMPWHCFHVIGSETDFDPTGVLLPRLRQAGYHKVISQLLYRTYEYDFLKRHLLLNVFPGGIGAKESAPSGMRESYRKLIPWMRVLHRLGWQPVTLATSESPDVWIERYGQTPGPVMLVVTNMGAGRSLGIDMPLADTPGGAQAWAWDPLTETPCTSRVQGEALSTKVALSSGQTALLAIGGPDAQAQARRMMARDRIADINLCCVEYELRNKAPHPLADNVKGLQDASEDDLPSRLGELVAGIQGEDVITTRMGELAKDTARLLAEAADPKPSPAEPLDATGLRRTLSILPLAEEFDGQLSDEVWRVSAEQGKVACVDGRLRLELKDPGSVSVATRGLLDFASQPVVLRTRLRNDRAEGSHYTGTFLGLHPVVDMQDRFLLRIDNGSQVWLSNGHTLASRWTEPLFDWKPLQPGVDHEIELQLDRLTYRLEIDDKLLGEGFHNLHFGCAEFSLSMQSGHGGHGDVWWVDSLKVSRPPAP